MKVFFGQSLHDLNLAKNIALAFCFHNESNFLELVLSLNHAYNIAQNNPAVKPKMKKKLTFCKSLPINYLGRHPPAPSTGASQGLTLAKTKRPTQEQQRVNLLHKSTQSFLNSLSIFQITKNTIAQGNNIRISIMFIYYRKFY